MSKQTTPPEGQPLTAALPTLDKYWAIENGYATNARRELERHDMAAHVEKFKAGYYSDDDDDAADDVPAKPYPINSDGVAILYLSGPITKRPTSMSYYFGGTSSVLMRRAVRQAAMDPDVKAIAIIIDSPGGQVNGTADLAADVAAAAEKKPVGAYAEDTCCSAAYWVGAQADFLYCNMTAAVGSIGTLLVIQDTSGAYAQEGVKVNVVSTGPYKGAGTDGAPVTKSHLADFQREVDDINACFLQGVVDGRDNLDMDQVKSLATGQVHIGQKAVDLGLADAVTSLDEFLESMAMQAEAMDDPDTQKNTQALPAGQQGSAGTSKSAETAHDLASFRDLASSRTEDTAEDQIGSTAEDFFGPDADTFPADTDAAADTPAFLTPSLSSFDLKETDTMPDEQQLVPAIPATVPALPATASSARTATNNDILAACQAAGITSAKDLEDRLTMATLGDQYAEDTREDAKVQAIRANGQAIGSQLASSCENLPIATVVAMRDGWKAEADKKFGISADGKAAERKSAPATTPRVSVSAEAGTDSAQPETLWSKLSAEQQKQGMQMGMSTPEQREKFAAQYQEVKETSN